MTWAENRTQDPMKENEPKKLIDSVLLLMDDVWKFVGARHGLQETEQIGAGFEGWYWRYSVAPSRVNTMH